MGGFCGAGVGGHRTGRKVQEGWGVAEGQAQDRERAEGFPPGLAWCEKEEYSTAALHYSTAQLQ